MNETSSATNSLQIAQNTPQYPPANPPGAVYGITTIANLALVPIVIISSLGLVGLITPGVALATVLAITATALTILNAFTLYYFGQQFVVQPLGAPTSQIQPTLPPPTQSNSASSPNTQPTQVEDRPVSNSSSSTTTSATSTPTQPQTPPVTLEQISTLIDQKLGAGGGGQAFRSTGDRSVVRVENDVSAKTMELNFD